jgi:glucose-6-phosphate 1-dehydrogenase
MGRDTTIEACTCVIFGATGDLARRKLIPALYDLDSAGYLPPDTRIVASGRRPWSQEYWLDQVEGMISKKIESHLDAEVWRRFRERLCYFRGDLNDPKTYTELKALLSEDGRFAPNILFYMSIRPAEFGVVTEHLSAAGLMDQADGWRRVILEKPFGYDLGSATALQARLSRYVDESQVFRIDHYLGKGTVQNVQVFRFANVMLEPLWNRNYIDHIQITHAESLGVGGRADYYDGAGALRDMLQSHLLQLLALVAMEPPVSMEAESMRDEKVKVLKSIRPIPLNAVNSYAFRAQYGHGIANGEKVKGYLEEDKVPPDSVCETYAALKLYIDNWRWRGVPFYLRTGKRMPGDLSMVSICFKHPPQQFFRRTQLQRMTPDWVLLGIQPFECLRIELNAKEPGLVMSTRVISLDANLRRDDEARPDAYESLLLDAMQGDRSLFLRYDEVDYAWRVVDPILRAWSTERDYIATYPAGSWGPEESARLFESEDQTWRCSLSPET